MVTFLIGEQKEPIQVHLNLICAASSVFKAAFSGPFEESVSRSMTLPDDDIESVERIVSWLYVRHYAIPQGVSAEAMDEHYWILARLNALAHKYYIITLSNHIVDELYKFEKLNNRIPQMPIVIYIYNNTSENSSFRKLLVAWHAWHASMPHSQHVGIRNMILQVPEFCADLAVASKSRLQYPEQKSPFRLEKSTYYLNPTKEVAVPDTKKSMVRI